MPLKNKTEGGWSRFLPPFGEKSVGRLSDRFSRDRVCVVGAGGDIGSALARTLADVRLESLVFFDSSEHGLFELRARMEGVAAAPACRYVLGSVCDRQSVDWMFRSFRPRIVFHAAAYKHVGMLEENPFAAIQNNVLGTDTLIDAASRYGVAAVVVLSTDKAVNPHSVMGVSKCIAERVALSHSSPAFRVSAIRLGNVIGSRGSVVPILLDCIKRKQDLPVTDPKASRYFIRRESAVGAILQAGLAECDGVVLIPELGDPVPIAELAGFLLRTFDHEGTLRLRFTGLRPGEKLVEELIGPRESRTGTVNGELTTVRGPGFQDWGAAAARLASCVAERDQKALLRQLQDLVPEYVPSELMRNGVQ